MGTGMSTINPSVENNVKLARVCLIDYGCGNVRSVYNMMESMGVQVQISNRVSDVEEASHLILPGVGTFGEAMSKLRQLNIIGLLEDNVLQKKKPFLGICVGMQILADRGTEHGEHQGLGWIPGSVDRMSVGPLPLPHVGWNNLTINGESPLLQTITKEVDFYFVHSYSFHAQNADQVNASFDYGGKFTAVISRGNIFGVQFHPEKSQKAGKILLRNFLKLK